MKSQYWLLKIKEMNMFIIFIKIYFLKNDFRESVILFSKIDFRGNVHSAKCTFCQVAILENGFSGKCPFGQMFFLESVLLESVFQGNVFLGGVRIPSLKT